MFWPFLVEYLAFSGSPSSKDGTTAPKRPENRKPDDVEQPSHPASDRHPDGKPGRAGSRATTGPAGGQPWVSSWPSSSSPTSAETLAPGYSQYFSPVDRALCRPCSSPFPKIVLQKHGKFLVGDLGTDAWIVRELSEWICSLIIWVLLISRNLTSRLLSCYGWSWLSHAFMGNTM